MLRRFHAHRALCTLLSALPLAAVGETFPGVEKTMSAEEFAAAGLAKLSAEERAALNAWIARYTGEETASEVAEQVAVQVAAKVAEVRRLGVAAEPREVTAERIVASIVPPFSGWSGRTQFTLDNGQVWRQRIDGRYRHSGDDTRVVIQRNFFGFHVMTLSGSGRAVGVERVR